MEGGFLELTQILFFEMPEEVFHGGIVPAVPMPRHRGCDVILLRKDIMIRLRSVLVPLVTVEDQSISDLLCLLGLSEGSGHQGDGIALGKGMSDNKPIVQIFDGG